MPFVAHGKQSKHYMTSNVKRLQKCYLFWGFKLKSCLTLCRPILGNELAEITQNRTKCYHFILKCPYYGFLKMTCHAVCNTALSEWKHPANFEIWKCTVYKVIVSQKKDLTLNYWNESFLKWIPSRFMLTSTWNISILPAHLLRVQTWENLIFALVWMNMQIHSLPLGAAFGVLKAHKHCFKWNRPITAD